LQILGGLGMMFSLFPGGRGKCRILADFTHQRFENHMNPDDPKYADALRRILTIMNELRSQCPWDRKQTMESLRHLTLEESHELADAILEQDMDAIKKELGDVLLHLVFYSKIASEQNAFDFADVIHALCDKMVHRHPHVYAEATVDSAEEVKHNWGRLKLKEQGGKAGILDGVPSRLAALIKAQRLQEKARGVGFDWPDATGAWDKVKEEIAELAHDHHDPIKAEEEFGDVLFSLVNYARFLNISPETALEKTNKKFIRRFQWMEQAAKSKGECLSELDLATLDAYWEQAKQAEKLNFG
jgi:XTP/dITP diphosphohydrolase